MPSKLVSACPALLLAISLVAALPAGAVTLTKVSETTPWPGVTLRKYRTASPSANAWAVFVDLCAAGIHVDATKYSSGFTPAGTWAQGQGAQLATNGDFFKASPTRVYGQSVGDGVPWPSTATGFDPAYATEWYYKDAGWFSFGYDGVEFSHTRQVKANPGTRTLGGWKPGTVTATFPPDALALVSGFPELVTEGVRATCTSPTATTCFPDRSDMRARHPRTAMGLTADRRTMILLVVDGRTTTSAGMYGTELAETIHKLGAWQAFNLDGGGSSQLWKQGTGYLNDYNGNNNGTGLRSVLNHWGVFAGTSSGKPARPGHCSSSAACQVLPATGGTLDNTGACFRSFGPAATWRSAAAGQGGNLVWTNAFTGPRADNWAWWRLELAAAGDYRVEFSVDAAYAKFASTRYEIFANGVSHPVTVNQSTGTGWHTLGTFHFAAGGDQFVRLFDNHPTITVPAGSRITADAVRLVPAGPACGDGTCNGTETCTTCAGDCGPCPTCGDGTCNGAETCETCAGDCGACCGNGVCDETEACGTCAADCGACPTCGDGACTGSEACDTCAADCGACCGDGVCDGAEDCASCGADCGSCGTCGDGTCGGTETVESCASDCDPSDSGAPCTDCQAPSDAGTADADGGAPDVSARARGCSSSSSAPGSFSLLCVLLGAQRRRRAPRPR